MIGQMEIGILDGFSSTLRYLNGNCSWRVTTIVAGNEVEVTECRTPDYTVSEVPSFAHLSAMFEDSSNLLRVQVRFRLAAKVCLSQFTIVIYGVVNVSFNVTRAEAAKGTVIYDLPSHISPMDVCDVQSEIYGGNVIGNSNSFSILVPEACLPSTSETLSTGEGRPSTSSAPPPVEMKQSDIPPAVIGSGKGSGVTEDVSLQTNEAYCTVTTGVPMKRNEAYETVLRPETDTLSPVYDIVHL
ncbi:hypothetical protein GBAR_LOCUS12489 [Geodia barretti]|uniref:Uncharacterized protein n=1 Tax=Geodia barretti TaxID=519541 RepID=A0AA35S123_GEOBA|nr:hypothetical protein GBAR_LOCUS12489 [Geodia barretti]